MICPRCSTEAVEGAVDCPSCGIIFAKWRAPKAASAPSNESGDGVDAHPYASSAAVRPAPWVRADPPPAPQPEYLGITHAGWKAAGIGGVMAFVLTLFPFLSFVLSPIHTLVHEIGHTVMFWIFGYPAIPAFDFGEGGGVTMANEREPMIVWGWVFGLVVLAWWQRQKPAVLAALAAVAIVYFVMYNGNGEAISIALGGHGGEVVFGTLFLYRGLTGWGCKIEAERPLYAFLAFFILFGTMKLGVSIMTDFEARHWYLLGKGGMENDLLTGAQMLNWRIESVARMMVLIAALGIPVAFWAAAIRKTIGAVSEAEEEI